MAEQGGAAADHLALLCGRAEQARAAGQAAEAAAIWRSVLAIDPDNASALNALGMQALSTDAAAAAALFLRAASADPDAAPLWMNLAAAKRRLGDAEGERVALERALAIDQRHLMGNVRLAELHDRLGEDHRAAFRWNGVVSVLQSSDRTPELDRLLEHAKGQAGAYMRNFGTDVDTRLATMRGTIGAGERRRFDACVDAILGRRRIYHNEPHGLHFPFLPADEFFGRRHFPWMPELEQAASAIRGELEALLTAPDSGFRPYVEMTPGSPINKWTPLDHSTAWSARYLWRYGKREEEVCARCPATAAVLRGLPLADMPGKGPTAFFSVLAPGARLPAHTGVSNVRAIVHLPLIVPPGCGFRVGGETRAWVEGEAFAFDDTIEHEAWNDGDALRAVLIFDVWNPHLSPVERDMLRTLFRSLEGLDDPLAPMAAVVD